MELPQAISAFVATGLVAAAVAVRAELLRRARLS